MKKICFVMPETYSVISGKGKQVGGAEFQSWLFANELSKKFDVRFIVKADKSGKEIKNGITIHKIRYLHPNIGYPKILRVMLDINADIYYQRTGGVATITTALFCLLKRKKFVFHVSRDEQLDTGYPFDKNVFIRWLYRFAVRRANVIFVQNNIQKKKLTRYGRKGIIVKNLIDISNNSAEKWNYILWVANISDAKQPLIYISLAKAFPWYKFVMIGNPVDERLFKMVLEEACAVPNLEFLGFRPFKETDEYFKKARVFVNTSKLEGFPNTFLQAWRYSTPVVSLNIDPDEIICKHKLGFHSKTFKAVKEHLRILMEDETLNRKLGENSKKYVKEEHDIKKLGNILIGIFMEI